MKKELNLICSLLLFSVTVAGQATCKFLNPELPMQHIYITDYQ